MLTPYICELLYTHNCVIVPGFGGFVSTLSPAEFNARTQILYPPYKRIAFNAALRNNDGLLANHIALLNNVSYKEAIHYIEKTVALWTEQLETRQQLKLDKLGSFAHNGSKWLFQPDSATNYNTQAYGYSPIHLLPVNTEKLRNKVDSSKQNRPPMEQQQKANREKLYRNIAIATPVAALLLWGALNPSVIGHLCTAGMGVFSKSSDIPPVTTTVPAPALQPAVSVDTMVVDATEGINEKRYYVVAGCFADATNAHKLVVDLRKRGYPATLAGTRKGMTVVSYENYADRREAVMAMHKIQPENPAVWIVRK